MKQQQCPVNGLTLSLVEVVFQNLRAKRSLHYAKYSPSFQKYYVALKLFL